MELLFGTDEAFGRHDTGPLHPERPARLRAVNQGVELSGLDVQPLDLVPAPPEMVTLVHAPAYLEALERFCRAGGGHLDPDTVAGAESYQAALLAAGAGRTAVENHQPGGFAFLAVRPPGHHALPERAMGFCLLNNVAITAAWLREQGSRVAILDWDVHHGNGTQAVFYRDEAVLYLSIHQYPFYPYVGDADEMGEGEGEGTTINLPVPAGTAGDGYRYLWTRLVDPVLDQFQPDWVLISAGYDAHHEDPLAELRLEGEDYGWMAWSLGRRVDPSRCVFFLEGGYHLPALTSSVSATLTGMAGQEPETTSLFRSPSTTFTAIDQVLSRAARYWSL